MAHSSAGENFLDAARAQRLDPLAAKVESELLHSINALHAGQNNATALTADLRQKKSATMAPAPAGQLPLLLDVPQVNDATLRAISATGATVTSSSARWNSVNVLATLEQLDALTQLTGVRAIKSARRPRCHQQGVANNQADGSMKADQARLVFGVSGAGQKIGVLSDSCNQTTAIGPGVVTGTVPNAILSGMVDQLSGDLPAQIQVIDFGPSDPPNTDEGSALMELIHDVAPNAAIAFASAYTSHIDFANNILKLRQAGCTIICDDVFYLEEPMFQDGPIAQAITTNYEAGVPHFSSAGNDADFGIRATYQAVNAANSQNGGSFHDWDIAGQPAGFLPIDLPASDDFTIVLQWNQPYQSFNLGPGASVDLNVYLLDAPSATANVLASSTEVQFANGAPSGDPFETFEYINMTGALQHTYLAVDKAAGAGNPDFRIVILSRRNETFPSGGNGLNSMTIYGHTACAEALSIGAILFADIDSGGGWRPDFKNINAESFSSKGGIGAAGIPLYFDTAGNALANAPQLRDKPDLAAPDGGNTSFFGQFDTLPINGVNYGDDNYPKFFGTSAATANAAAAAALLLERAPLSSPAQIKHALQSTALDIVATAPLSVVGPDDVTGAGLVNALAAAHSLPAVETPPIDQTVVETASATFSASVSGAGTLTYQWRRNGVAIAGATSATLTINNASFDNDDGALFDCIIANDNGTLPTSAALLRVLPFPKITQQPADALVNLNMPVSFTVTAIHGPLTYQWLRNGAAIPYATDSAYTLPSASAADDNATFSCVVTNPQKSIPSTAATLHLDSAPSILSAPSANPPVAAAGAPVQFTLAALGAFNQPLTITWDFGDGTSAQGASVVHTFYLAQHYTVTVTAADPLGLSTAATLDELVYFDADGDGSPDLDPGADNSLYPETVEKLLGLTPQPLHVNSMRIALNFKTQNADSLVLSGLLPQVIGDMPVYQQMPAVIGGVGRVFVFGAASRGAGVSPARLRSTIPESPITRVSVSLAVALAQPNGVFKLRTPKSLSEPAQFTLTITHANLQPFLAADGLTNKNAAAERDTVRVTLFYNGRMFDKLQPQFYTAKLGQNGKTK